MADPEQKGYKPKTEWAAEQKEFLKRVIQDVIAEKFEIFNVDTMANYDADFSGETPFFINIIAKQKGFGYGHIVFHDFLRRVGLGKTFLSTDFTDDGKRLFTRCERDGLIKKIEDPKGINRLSKWEVTQDPNENLRKMIESLN